MEETQNAFCGKGHHDKVFKPLFGLITLLLLVSVVFVGASAVLKIKEWRYVGLDVNARQTISVSETGEVYAKPDLAITTFSVLTEALTVAEAMESNTQKMNAVIEAVKAEGVEDKDLKTTNFSINPRYEYYGVSSYYPSGNRVLAGYEVSQSLQVKIRDLAKVGKIVQIATEKGSNQSGDLQFTIEEQDALKQQAREEAIAKAKTKAQNLAQSLGVKLVRITNFSESGEMPYYYGLEKSSAVGFGGGAAVPQIETGQNRIQVTVYLTYEIY
jgi:uncharacterized protein YggE